MKVYIICFDEETIAYPTAFLDKAQAEERLKIMQDEMDADADERQRKSYSQWYSVEELEVVFGEAQPMTLEEIYEL